MSHLLEYGKPFRQKCHAELESFRTETARQGRSVSREAHGLSDADYEKAARQARIEAGIDTAKRELPAMAERAQNAAAVERGSQEAFSAMVKAMNGRRDIEAQIEKNTLDTARETKLLAKTMKRTQKDQITIKQLNLS